MSTRKVEEAKTGGLTYPCGASRASSFLGMPEGSPEPRVSVAHAAQAGSGISFVKAYLADQHNGVVVPTPAGLILDLKVCDGDGPLDGLLERDHINGHCCT